MSYKIQCYEARFGPNQNRILGWIDFGFIPRVGDTIIFNIDHPVYDDRVMGKVSEVEIDTTKIVDIEITLLLEDVGSV